MTEEQVMTKKQIISAKVCFWCGIGFIVTLLITLLISLLSSPPSEARVDADSGFFEPIEGRRVLPPSSPSASALRSFENPIPTIIEIQALLAEKGYYKGKIDGKLAPNWRESQTQAAWDKAICDQYARKYFTGAVATDGRLEK